MSVLSNKRTHSQISQVSQASSSITDIKIALTITDLPQKKRTLANRASALAKRAREEENLRARLRENKRVREEEKKRDIIDTMISCYLLRDGYTYKEHDKRDCKLYLNKPYDTARACCGFKANFMNLFEFQKLTTIIHRIKF